MKYPLYTREQSKSCKLTDDQIKEIRRLYKEGIKRSELARIYGVAHSTIKIWCLTPREKKAYHQKLYEYHKNKKQNCRITPQQRKAFYDRKKRLTNYDKWHAWNEREKRKIKRQNK